MSLGTTLKQIVAYDYLMNRDYSDDLSDRGVDHPSELTVEKIQLMIDRYCQEEGENSKAGYLHNYFALPQEHFDFAFDMGVAMQMLGGIK